MANYQNKFSTALTYDTLAGATSSQLLTIPSVDAPFYLAFDATNDNGKYEVVTVTSKTDSGVNHAATTYDHVTTETVRLIFPAAEINDLSVDVQTLSEDPLDAGIIRPYAGPSAPSGWVLCDGTSYERTGNYAALFAAIGTTYGAADGTHFNVPDVRGRMVMGFDSGDTAFDTLGETGGARTADISHTHAMSAHTHSASGTTAGPSGTATTGADDNTTLSTSGHTHSWSYTTGAMDVTPNADTQGSTTQSILMPYLTLNLIIKL